MTHEVSIFAALVAGIVSFLSPCVLPLVPPYLVYLTGAAAGQGATDGAAADGAPKSSRGAVMLAAVVFVLGFSTVFVALGASATLIGAVLRAYAYQLAMVAGVIIIIMGLHFLGVTRIGFLMREGRFGMAKPGSLLGAYVMGLAFAFGWTPCIGPILAAILAVAASEATVAKGAGLLAVYSAGLGIPFLIAAFAVDRVSALLRRFRNQMQNVERAMGVLMIVTGIAFLTGSITDASIWLLETFPKLGELG